jgi:hypothetical protein
VVLVQKGNREIAKKNISYVGDDQAREEGTTESKQGHSQVKQGERQVRMACKGD